MSLPAEMWPDPSWSSAGDKRAPYPPVDRPRPRCSALAGDTYHAKATCVVVTLQPFV